MFHEALENQQRSLNHLQMWTLQCFEVCPCVTCTRVPLTVRRGCWTPWSWGHRCCEPLLWVLGIKLWSSARTASALNLRVTSLAWPPKFFLKQCFNVAQAILELTMWRGITWNFWSPCVVLSSVGIVGVHHQPCFMQCWDGTQGLYTLGKHSTSWATPPALNYIFTKHIFHSQILMKQYHQCIFTFSYTDLKAITLCKVYIRKPVSVKHTFSIMG